MQKSKKTTRKSSLPWLALIVAAIALVISLTAISLKTFVNPSDNSVKIGEEFSMKVGELVYLSDIKDATLKLEEIQDNRCISDKNIVCDWQGELIYRFSYEEDTIAVSSILEPQQPLGGTGYILYFVFGDETAGTFVLRKEEK